MGIKAYNIQALSIKLVLMIIYKK